jgi:hypothetical protein
MRLLLVATLLTVGCASAPPPEPRVVERVVYVSAPCPAPVIVERQGGHHAGPRAKPKAAPRRHPNPWRLSQGAKRHEKQEKLAKRCDKKKTPEARARCRRDVARR